MRECSLPPTIRVGHNEYYRNFMVLPDVQFKEGNKINQNLEDFFQPVAEVKIFSS